MLSHYQLLSKAPSLPQMSGESESKVKHLQERDHLLFGSFFKLIWPFVVYFSLFVVWQARDSWCLRGIWNNLLQGKHLDSIINLQKFI